ncbi:mitogen-activated protein kinase kinase kinase 5-like isoform X2 [Juglans microcarpa x Juglans regia]|uniref:mitogen-activated protein kinase kinase kinase 5-like isoform X2 n=1 Tax=Juglans microcarpa x Juglans regia TaxID=2249226 RepID=UPI001B7F3DD3|nr:mitogen-activated protein kinase kinase kinase 5-like isoform X2 [Juglans microcarpa x Juglans regia]
MLSFFKHSSSSSSSSSSSPSSSSLKSSSPSVSAPTHGDGALPTRRGQTQSFTQRRLTRQRKLRHPSDRDLGLQLSEGSYLSPPGSPKKSHSWGESEHWSCSAVPQRLPLPELSSSWRPESTALNSGHARLGSPKEGSASSLGRSCQTSVFSSPVVSPQRQNARELFPTCVTPSSLKFSNNYCRGFFQDLNDECVNGNFSLKVPARSAPTSVFSSPAGSPRRLSSRDLFPSSLAFQEYQHNHVGCYSNVQPTRTMPGPDQSPLHGPILQSSHPSHKSPNRTVFPSHHKFVSESYVERPEISAHPLPLPPGAVLSPQSSMQPQSTTTIQHVIEQPCVSSFTGQWIKGKLIGRGTFGSVYLATNRESGALCAMKEVDLIPDDPKSLECVKQLEQEIKILSQLKHPNIVQYFGSEINDDRFYIYLEYVHPGSINKYVNEHCGAITESVIRHFTRHILSGLAFLHSTKTIHRDIKGANLLVDASGIVKLADFGLSKHLTGESYNLSLKGSPYWMAPEVMQAAMQNSKNPNLALAVDIWSLGCTIIEMLNGKPPWCEFSGDKRHTIADDKENKDVMSIGTRIMSRNLPFIGATCQHYGSCKCPKAFYHPPSAPQAFPGLSTTECTRSSHSCSPSNIFNNVSLGTVNNHSLAHTRIHGREVSHL